MNDERGICVCGHEFGGFHRTPGTECAAKDCGCSRYSPGDVDTAARKLDETVVRATLIGLADAGTGLGYPSWVEMSDEGLAALARLVSRLQHVEKEWLILRALSASDEPTGALMRERLQMHKDRERLEARLQEADRLQAMEAAATSEVRGRFIAAEACLEAAREALRLIANADLHNLPGINPDGSVSTSTMAQTLARAALVDPDQREQADSGGASGAHVEDDAGSGLKKRADGWPLCPVCGEDELGDLRNVPARADADLFCYRCGRVTVRERSGDSA